MIFMENFKILLIKYRNIGDVILSSCLVDNLKLNYPKSTIDYATNKECYEAISLNPNINKFYLYDRKKIRNNMIARLFDFYQTVSCIRQKKYDLIINLTEGDHGAYMSLFSKAKIRLGFPPRKGFLSKINLFNKIGDDKTWQPTVLKDLQFINLLGKDVKTKKTSFYFSEDDAYFVKKLLQENNIRRFVLIHPVSRWMFKCWEDDRMAKVIDYLIFEKSIDVVITCSKASTEQERVRNILKKCRSKPLVLFGVLNLKQLGALIKRSEFFFGVDSAPMHIAAAINKTILALFGASYPALWGPWSNENNDSFFEDKNGLQTNGKHLIISNMDHRIFYEFGVKKTKGMVKIVLSDVKNAIDLIMKDK